jgi:hypothetical protein
VQPGAPIARPGNIQMNVQAYASIAGQVHFLRRTDPHCAKIVTPGDLQVWVQPSAPYAGEVNIQMKVQTATLARQVNFLRRDPRANLVRPDNIQVRVHTNAPIARPGNIQMLIQQNASIARKVHILM